MKLSEHDIFVCDEESHFYSQCIDRLLLRAHRNGDTVIEFGSGDGTPVINSLKQVRGIAVMLYLLLSGRGGKLADLRLLNAEQPRCAGQAGALSLIASSQRPAQA